MAFHIHNQVSQVFSQVLPDSTQDRAESLSFRVHLLNAFHANVLIVTGGKKLILCCFVLVIVTLSERQPTANSILHIKSLQ